MTSSVRQYYEHNTDRFLRFGGGARVAAIHRKLWAPGVSTTDAALNFINSWITSRWVLNDNHDSEKYHFLDVGCGVGGTAHYLAMHGGACVTGVTLSRRQAELAVNRARALGITSECNFLVADFGQLPALGTFDGAYAIEAFSHSTDPRAFFHQVSSQLKTGKELIIIDDVLADGSDESGNSHQKAMWLERFRQGWRLGSLLDQVQINELAEEVGLKMKSSTDFSPLIRKLSPFQSLILSRVGKLPLTGTYWQSISGGIALQICITNGWTAYKGLVFEKVRTLNADE